MSKKQINPPLASLKCDVCYTEMRAEDYPPGPLVCPTCGRWVGIVKRT